MSVDVKYRTKASATGGRDGRAATEDGSFSVGLSTPKELGGAGGQGNNPEQLFAAGYAACFANAMRSSARREGREEVVEGATVTAYVAIGAIGGGRFGLGVKLEADVPQLAQADAEELVSRAHDRCPYSNATRGNIDVELVVRGGAAVSA